MRNVWLRIGLGAGLVFLLGMVVVRVFRAGRDQVAGMIDMAADGDAPIPIPLMGVVPFQVGDARLGDLRRVTLLREIPHQITGVNFLARMGDSATIEPLKDCTFLTLAGVEGHRAGVDTKIQFNDDTRFTCLHDSTGYSSFGKIEVRHTQGKEETTLVRTLVLPPELIADIQKAMGKRDSLDAAALQDSIRAVVDSVQREVQIQVQEAEGRATTVRVQSGSAPAPVPAPAPPAPSATPRP